MTITMPSYIREALEKLNAGRHEAYVVGGCVRDFLLGIPPGDWDICTSALPEEILACFEGRRVIEVGRRHGTIGVRLGGRTVEITTFRVDGDYSDNRRPDRVLFTRSLLEDLGRRDFTVNAMAYHPNTGLIDAYGGGADLSAGLIRCVGDPDRRFEEDALRILRALRFASALGFSLENRTAKSVQANRELLRNIAAERIAQETNRILLGKHAAAVLDAYSAVFAVFLPELLPVIGFSRGNPGQPDLWRRTLRGVASAPRDLNVRLALLLREAAGPAGGPEGTGMARPRAKAGAETAAEILRRLKYDRGTVSTVSQLIAMGDMPLPSGDAEVKRCLCRVGERIFRLLLAVRRAALRAGENTTADLKLKELGAAERTFQRVLSQGQCFSLGQLAVNGRDLQTLGMGEGPTVGVVLGRLLEQVIDGTAPNERGALLEMARSMLKAGL